MKYKRYPKYKDSDVEWIGEIPEGWEARKLKFALSLLKDGSHNPPPRTDSGIKFIPGATNIKNSKVVFENCPYITKEDYYDIHKSYQLQSGDVLLTIIATLGNVAMVEEHDLPFSMQRSIAVLRPNSNITSKFLFYFLHSYYFQRMLRIKSRSTVKPGVYLELLKNISIVTSKQQNELNQIVEFLDKQTTQFDELIAKSKAQITLLEEKKQATINQAVTKGLDPSVPMKYSGVDWIGDIPKTWEIKPLFSVCKDNKKKNFGNKIKNVLSLSYGTIKRRDVETNFGLLPVSFETYQILDDGDIVLRLTDLQNDKRSLRVGLVNEQGIITSAYTGLKIDNSINSGYLYNLLHFYDITKIFYGLGSGVRQSMNFSDLKRLPLVIPPINESDKIYNFLNQQTIYFDELIAKSKVQVNLLKEKRQTLITETVTGKIDVREVIA